MDLYSVSNSFLSTVFIGFNNPNEGYSAVTDSFAYACAAVPPIQVVRKKADGLRKTVSVPHTRMVVSFAGIEGQCLRRARCVDLSEGESAANSFNKWQWEVSLIGINRGHFSPEIPDHLSTYALDTSRFRISGGVVRNAAQLALFRCLFIQRLRALDPQLVALGGQMNWEKMMWKPGVLRT